MKPIRLDGRSLTRDRLVEVAYGAQVMLDDGALRNVAHAAAFLAEGGVVSGDDFAGDRHGNFHG